MRILDATRTQVFEAFRRIFKRIKSFELKIVKSNAIITYS